MQPELTTNLINFIKTNPLLCISWLVVFAVTLYSFFKDLTRKFKIIDNPEAIKLMNEDNGVVVDLRSMDVFNKAHIVGSVNVFPIDIQNQNYVNLEKHKNTPIIIVDRDANSITAEKSAQILATNGFEKVFMLKGGISGWRSANLPFVNKHNQ